MTGIRGTGLGAQKTPRLLYLAYSFPPVNRVGAIRAYNEAKYLAALGWQVTVVTPDESVWKSTERADEVQADLQRRGVRSIRTDHRWRMLSHDSLAYPEGRIRWAIGGVWRRIARAFEVEREAGWTSEAAKATAGLEASDVDVILASGPPFVSFRLARDLSKRLGKPYVLGYRDLWSNNPHAMIRSESTLQEETSLLAGASSVEVISEGLRASLERRFGITGKIHVVTNGYDPTELEGVEPHRFGHFAIVYAGVFYPPKRVITPVMQALARLKDLKLEGDENWAFHYFGNWGAHVRQAAAEAGVLDRVVLHGSVSRREALGAIKGAGIAVVITSIDEEGSVEDRGIVTGKVFDAVGLGTPLLVIAPNGSDLDGILATAGLGRRFTGRQIGEMTEYLKMAIEGATPAPGDQTAFAWPSLVGRLDKLLRDACNGRRV